MALSPNRRQPITWTNSGLLWIGPLGTKFSGILVKIQKFSFTKMPWWRHQMETFSALLAICAGNSPVPGEFPTQRPVTRSFDVFFDQRLNKRLSKQPWGWWFETPAWSLWRHHNALECVGCEMAAILSRWRWVKCVGSLQYKDGVSPRKESHLWR